MIILIVRLCVSFYSHPLHLSAIEVILQGIYKLTLYVAIFERVVSLKVRM